MKVAAYSVRLGGTRSYENGMIDIGAVVLNDDSFEDEFYCLMSPDDNKSYRPGALRFAGVSFDQMYSQGSPPVEACMEFLWWAAKHPGVWSHDQAFPEFINGTLRYAGFSDNEKENFLVGDIDTDRFGNPVFRRNSDIKALYDILRSFGVRGPAMKDFPSLMNWAGVDSFKFEVSNALEQAKSSALTLRNLRDRLGSRIGGNKELLELP